MKANLKVTILAAAYPPDIKGGGEISTQVLAQSLSKIGHSVIVLACGREAVLRQDGEVEVTQIKSPNIYWNFDKPSSRASRALWHYKENFNNTAFDRILDYLKNHPSDVVLTSTIENFGSAAWTAPYAVGVKTIHILRSYYPLCWRGTMYKGASNCVNVCTQCRIATLGRLRASKYVSGVIGLSKHTLDAHISAGFFPEAKRTGIPDPVSVSTKERKAKGSSQRPFVFGYIGVITPNKGVELISDAITKCKREKRILIAGSGEQRYVDHLKTRFDPRYTSFLGWVDPEVFFPSIDALIVPSIWYEPFGRIVVEAFAAGIPVIGSNRGGVGEMVRHKFNGLVFDPVDSSNLALAMEQMEDLDDHTFSDLSLRALESAKEYDGIRIAHLYEEFFKEVLKV